MALVHRSRAVAIALLVAGALAPAAQAADLAVPADRKAQADAIAAPARAELALLGRVMAPVCDRDPAPRPGGERDTPVCDFALEPLDSRYRYIDTRMRTISATLPLLQSLDGTRLRIVLAHEAAHIVLGHGLLGDEAGRLAARALFGKLAEIGQNSELQRSAPDPNALIAADRMALWTLEGLGITPAQVRDFVREMDAEEVPLGAPRYATLRPALARRMAALDAAATLYERERKLLLPAGVPKEKLQAVRVAARAWRDEGRTAHARPLPPASGWAEATELDKVPLGAGGRERYRHYLGLAAPKAFAVRDDGAWRFTASDPEAMEKALRLCLADGHRCWLYAVDDRVVWRDDPAQRIGSPEALPKP